MSCDTDTLTAFEQKISLFESGECGGSTEDAEDQEEPSSDNVTGYRLVDEACVRGLVEALLCPTCHAGGLKLLETCVTFVMECSDCGVIISAPLSSNIDGTQQTELHRMPRFYFTELQH